MDWLTFAAILATLGTVFAMAAGIQALRPTSGEEVAQAIQRGIDRAATPDPDALADEALTHDANEAGYHWAQEHGLDRIGGCPAYSRAFQAGCEAYVKEQTH
jgi:hypothetical protein